MANDELTLTGTAGQQKAQTNEEGELVLSAAPDTVVLLTVTVPPQLQTKDLSWLRDGKDAQGLQVESDKKTASLPSIDEQTAGRYVVRAKLADDSTKDSNALQLKQQVAADESEEEAGGGENVVLPPIGEWSRGFAWVTGITAAVLYIVVVGAVIQRLVDIGVPDQVLNVGENQEISGTFGESLAATLLLLGVALGALLTVFGGWMAALEVRGRMTSKPVVAPVGVARGPEGVDIPGMIDKAAKLRGTVATLLAGVAIMLGVVWGAGKLADEETPPTTTTTTQPGQPATPAQPDEPTTPTPPAS